MYKMYIGVYVIIYLILCIIGGYLLTTAGDTIIAWPYKLIFMWNKLFDEQLNELFNHYFTDHSMNGFIRRTTMDGHVLVQPLGIDRTESKPFMMCIYFTYVVNLFLFRLLFWVYVCIILWTYPIFACILTMYKYISANMTQYEVMDQV